jgi:predicted RNase H-like nuclease (RuvC/YqgF family)
MSYRSDEDYQTDVVLPAVSHRRTGEFLQRDPDRYKPDYGSARSPAQAEKTTNRNKSRNCAATNSVYADDEINRLQTKNRSLKVELDDHAARLELLKTDNDNLIQRLGDARKDRERIEQELERERREFREKMREFEKARGDWKVKQRLYVLYNTCKFDSLNFVSADSYK